MLTLYTKKRKKSTAKSVFYTEYEGEKNANSVSLFAIGYWKKSCAFLAVGRKSLERLGKMLKNQ